MSMTTGWSCRHCGCAGPSGNDCPAGGHHEPAQVGPVTDQTALLIALDAAVATARRQADERNHDHQV